MFIGLIVVFFVYSFFVCYELLLWGVVFFRSLELWVKRRDISFLVYVG